MVHPIDESLSAPVFFLAGLFMVVRKGRDGLVVFLLVLVAAGCAGWITFWAPPAVRPAQAVAFAGLVYLFFSRGDSVEKLYTAAVVLYAFLVSCRVIFTGPCCPADAVAGIIAGIGCSGLVYTLFAWIMKYSVSTNR